MSVDYEYKTRFQSNLNKNETINMGRKAPAVSKRIFSTLNDAQLYIDNLDDSAIAGLIITVLEPFIFVEDSNGRHYGEDDYIETKEFGDYDGVYRVVSIGDEENSGELEKVCRGDVAWFRGNAVNVNRLDVHIPQAKAGDIYLNINTLDLFMLGESGTWTKIANLLPQSVEHDAVYYKLSTDGVNHPAWSLNTWVKANETGTNIPHNYTDFNSSQVYLWSRFYDEDKPGGNAKYTVSLVYSTLNLGTFSMN